MRPSVEGWNLDLPAGTELFHVAAGLGHVWAMDTEGWIHKIEPQSGAVEERVARVGEGSGEIALGARALWVNNYEAGVVVRINPRNYAKRVFPTGAAKVADLTFGAGSVVVASDSDRRLVFIDPVSGKVESVSLPANPMTLRSVTALSS